MLFWMRKQGENSRDHLPEVKIIPPGEGGKKVIFWWADLTGKKYSHDLLVRIVYQMVIPRETQGYGRQGAQREQVMVRGLQRGETSN